MDPVRKPRRTHSIDDVLYYFSNKPVDTIETVDSLVIDDWPRVNRTQSPESLGQAYSRLQGQISVMWIRIVTNAFGSATCVPVMLAKGLNPDKTVGLTAGLHGNEASGIPTIQKMFHSLAALVDEMNGCVVAIPCCNQFGFENSSRFYQDGADLNCCFTNAGLKCNDADAASQPRSVQFANNLFDKILVHCDIIFDIHTASFGRENSFYVRADMNVTSVAHLARRLQPQIIVHTACTGSDEGEGTLREACTANRIDCLSIQIGECLSFDRELIARAYTGIGRVLHYLNIAYLPEYQELDETLPPTVICTHSFCKFGLGPSPMES